MPKYRVKDVVGEIRHGVGKELSTYRAGETLDLSEADAKPLLSLIERLPEEGGEDKKKD